MILKELKWDRFTF